VKAVIQEEVSGCGIAAVAALAGVSYGQAKRRANGLGIEAQDRSLWSDTDYVRRLLKTYGLHASSGEIPFSDWETLPDRALLAIKWHREKGTPFWHWVVFVRDGEDAYVLDSKKALTQNCRRDFGRMKPKWFIPVITG
jgi:hypothetical protein